MNQKERKRKNMNFNKLLKETVEKMKKYEVKLPLVQERYDKAYWEEFVAEILEKGSRKINGVKFAKNEEINNSFGGEIYKITEIYPENEEGNKIDARIILTDGNDKTFVFEAGEFSFGYDRNKFVFTRKAETASKNLMITNSVEKVNDLSQLGIKNVKFIFSNAGVLTDELFAKFIVEPKEFGKFVEELWEEMARPFVIKYDPVESDQNKPFELLNMQNDGFENRYSTVHANDFAVSAEEAIETENENVKEAEELNKAVELKKENENQNSGKKENDL